MGRKAKSPVARAPKVFGDTSYFYALADPKDEHHVRALVLSREVAAAGASLFTTWDVVVECVTMLRYRLGYAAAARFLWTLEIGLTVFHPSDDDRSRAIESFLSRSRVRALSLCDAISYVVVSRHFDWAPCLAFDSDFAALGLTVWR